MSLKAIRAVAVFIAAIALSGCMPTDHTMPPECPGPDPCSLLFLTVTGDLTVVLDARKFGGDTYHWDFGEEEGIDRTTTNGLIQHTFAQPGDYAVIVYVEGGAPQDGNGGGGGPAIGGDGGAAPGEVQDMRSGFAIARLKGEGGPTALIVALRNNQPSGSFFSFDAPVFWGGASSTDANDGLWYQWKAERRYRPTFWEDGGWVTHPWTPWEEMDRYQGETWSPGHNFFRVPGSDFSQKPLETMQYRITLTVTDAYSRQNTTQVVLTIYTAC